MKHIRLRRNVTSKKEVDICKIFVFYWIVLIIWQNAVGAQNRGGVDALLKVLLLGYLTFSFFRVKTSVNKKTVSLWIVFAVSQITTFLLRDSNNVSLGIGVQYIYPSLLLFLVHCVGNDFSVTKKQVDRMNVYVLIVLVVSILYILIFEPSQYYNAINAQNSGYGNELCSFFASMHEYAVYLFYGIAVCVNRIVDKEKGRVVYYLLLIIFFVTMIFTFSRTAIVACVIYLLVYSVINIKETISKMIIMFAILFFLMFSLKTSFYEYVFQVVWKSGETSSRDILLTLAYDYIANGSLLDKIFGHGIMKTQLYFKTLGEYSSIHNGYLQVLVYYGYVGLFFMVSYLLVQFTSIIKTFRKDGNVALSSLGMLIFCILAMVPQTFVIFTSSIDCYFITIMLLVIPKYQRNAVSTQQYY